MALHAVGHCFQGTVLAPAHGANLRSSSPCVSVKMPAAAQGFSLDLHAAAYFGESRKAARRDFFRVNAKVATTAAPNLDTASDPPLNLFKPKTPYTATIKSVERIVGDKAPGETCHIVIDHGGNVPYWEGQSYGVIPPGENPKKPGTPNAVRLYSIASTRYGDDFDGKTASLCVRRAVYWDPETGKEDPAKKGVCSNFLCDRKPGDKVQITGPSGKIMLLPESNPKAAHIMIATGTGIAPFRGYLRRMFMEDVSFKFGGLAWLFLGVANRDSLLYHDEFEGYLKEYPDNFRYDIALSREQNNKRGGKMYVQDKIEEYSEEVFKLLDEGAHIYFCGLKGMMPGIQDTLKRVAEERGESWEEKLSMLKKKKQWHVEVY
ncbi:ferredoxin--NADP reductase, embryo isozyme, chloroplastic [Selaginella moellendorffii]|uniref:ferredoxin--NADP reductase, embryo isozyme, chloroplastic n=1 Tax=Selaginella moellendorffii TaxID=88036 RepID=UPI000D1C6AD5|nr:ferredoxin--NADP reductase, embryo isozyme, chloroplastic [Selaginella moellendorffii]XP_024542928.1 ferredoxin--NADP reductase, embryo isozyme, chloroplastic [Selaginella moellendorffii]|eukprot:XP_024542927.1 ferredoxin--NADP reductase, embryo isozyme, chloroplastic [Selaginella moellendorffii]